LQGLTNPGLIFTYLVNESESEIKFITHTRNEEQRHYTRVRVGKIYKRRIIKIIKSNLKRREDT